MQAKFEIEMFRTQQKANEDKRVDIEKIAQEKKSVQDEFNAQLEELRKEYERREV